MTIPKRIRSYTIQWCFLISFLLTSFTVSAELVVKVPQSPDDMQAVEVAPDVYVSHGLLGMPTRFNRGMIANTGFVVSSEGVIVIDSGGTPEQARSLLAAIKKITDKPVVAAINTHIHGDHWLGNQSLIEAFPDIVIYGHPDMLQKADNGAGDTWVALYEQLTEGTSGDIVPAGPHRTLADAEELRFGDVRVRAHHTGVAHTDNDLLVHIEASGDKNVVFLGDLSFNRRLGRMDDGHFKGNIAAIEKALALNAAIYVPGHGPTTEGPVAASHYRDLLNTLYAKTAELFEQGLTDFEIRDKIRPHFDRWSDWDGFDDGFGRHVNLVYLEVEEDSF